MINMNQVKDWNNLADDYVFGTWFGDYIEVPAMQNRFRGKVSGLHILDIGCGYGKHSKFFCDEGAQVVGVDTAENMLVLAKKKAPMATFYSASACDLSVLGSKQFDLIVAVFLFPNIKTADEFQKCCTQMRAHLKPSGQLVIYDRHPMAFCNTSSELTKILLPPGVGYYDNGCQFEVKLRLKNGKWIQFYNYHWTLEHWHTQLRKAGFCGTSFVEPRTVKIVPQLTKDFAPHLLQPLHMMLEMELAQHS